MYLLSYAWRINCGQRCLDLGLWLLIGAGGRRPLDVTRITESPFATRLRDAGSGVRTQGADFADVLGLCAILFQSRNIVGGRTDDL